MNDSGPIGSSLMVTVNQLWMIHTMESAIKIAKVVGSLILGTFSSTWMTVGVQTSIRLGEKVSAAAAAAALLRSTQLQHSMNA